MKGFKRIYPQNQDKLHWFQRVNLYQIFFINSLYRFVHNIKMYKQISIISLLFILLALGEAQVGTSQGRCSKGDTLLQNQYLLPGQQLFSNGNSASLQYDGNFVIYANNRAIWATKTRGWRAGVKLFMHKDGNLALYSRYDSSPVWDSNTAGKGIPPYRLVMQSDRNLTIYDGRNQTIWFTGTNL